MTLLDGCFIHDVCCFKMQMNIILFIKANCFSCLTAFCCSSADVQVCSRSADCPPLEVITSVLAARILPSIHSVSDRNYFHKPHKQKCSTSICDIKVQRRESFTVLNSKHPHPCLLRQEGENEMRLCFCVFQDQNNISDWLHLVEQWDCLTKTFFPRSLSALFFLWFFFFSLLHHLLSSFKMRAESRIIEKAISVETQKNLFFGEFFFSVLDFVVLTKQYNWINFICLELFKHTVGSQSNKNKNPSKS